MEKLIDWCRFNKLALNPSKCEYMLLTNKHVVHQPNIHLNGELLKRAHIFKYLGIYLDDKVKFNDHVDYLKSPFNILKLKDLHTFYVNVYMFKVIKTNICPNLQSDLDLRIRDRCYSTRGNGVYAVPFPRVENIRINY